MLPLEKLEQLTRRYAELEELMCRPDVLGDRNQLGKQLDAPIVFSERHVGAALLGPADRNDDGGLARGDLVP